MIQPVSALNQPLKTVIQAAKILIQAVKDVNQLLKKSIQRLKRLNQVLKNPIQVTEIATESAFTSLKTIIVSIGYETLWISSFAANFSFPHRAQNAQACCLWLAFAAPVAML
ncbi:MAG: hypothetical protein HY242_06230 [Afipia sp.]|nr:hypothetical protein [Afipia sp.]